MMNKKGLTIAEAVISMVLLAIITMGVYGVIMASIRSSKKPDVREDMAYAIEAASARLHGLIQNKYYCFEWTPLNYDCKDTPDEPCCIDWRQDRCCTDIKMADLTFNDLCDRPFTGTAEARNFARSSPDSKAPAPNVSDPFQENVYYFVDFQKQYSQELCLLPASCDVNNSFFYYTVRVVNKTEDGNMPLHPRYNIQFKINCGGQTMTKNA